MSTSKMTNHAPPTLDAGPMTPTPPTTPPDDRMVVAAMRGTWSMIDNLDFGNRVVDITGAARILGMQREAVRRMTHLGKWRPLFDRVGRGTRASGIPHTGLYLAHRVAIAAYLINRRGQERGWEAYAGIEDDIRRAMAYPDEVVRGAQRFLERLGPLPEDDE